MNPVNTIFDAKRLIGRKWDDPSVQADAKHWAFKLVNEGGKPKIQVEYKGEQKTFTPEEISSMVLSSDEPGPRILPGPGPARFAGAGTKTTGAGAWKICAGALPGPGNFGVKKGEICFQRNFKYSGIQIAILGHFGANLPCFGLLKLFGGLFDCYFSHLSTKNCRKTKG